MKRGIVKKSEQKKRNILTLNNEKHPKDVEQRNNDKACLN